MEVFIDNKSIERSNTDKPLLDINYLTLTLQSIPGAVAIINPKNYNIISINKQFETYFGYNLHEINQENTLFTDILCPNQTKRLLNQLKDSINNVDLYSSYIIYNLLTKAGEEISFYLYSTPLYFENIIYSDYFFILMHPNILTVELPFWSLETKKVFLEQLCGEDFGIYEWLLDTNIIYLSKDFNLIFEDEQSITEVQPEYLLSFIHPEDKEMYKNEVKNSVINNINADFEIRLVTALGNIKIMHIVGQTFKKTNLNKGKYICSFRDVTKQRLIEQNYKKKVDELNNSNKELEEFAYVASHDLQEPLRKISTFTSRLAEKYKDILDGDGAMFLERTIASTDNMRMLINDLLEFSRIAKTKQPFSTVDLNSVLRIVKTDLEIVIEESKTIVESTFLPVVEGIPTQFNQLFNNIISNAIKFRKPDVEPVIIISSELVTQQEKIELGLLQNCIYYKISTTDNGLGFDEIYAIKIFQAFQRLYGKSEYPGSGIGLAICKKIVEYHHGVIYAQSKPNIGSTFVIIIPENQNQFVKNN